MKLDRRTALSAVLVVVLVTGSALAADAPKPSSAGGSGDGLLGRWIRKTPVAPLPIVPTPPLPASTAIPSLQPEQPEVPVAEMVPPNGPAESGLRRAQWDVRLAQAQPLQADSAGPPPQRTMALAEAERIAVENNPTLAQAAMRIQAAEGRCIQAGLYPNPVVGYEGDEIGAYGTSGEQGGFVSQQIVTAGKLQLGSAVAAHEIVQAEHGWHAQHQRVLNDVRAAWYEVLAAQRIVELNRRLVAVGQQAVQTAGELLARKEVNQADQLQARIEADSAQIRLHQARNRYNAAWHRLAVLLGLPEMEPAVLSGELDADLPELSWDKSLMKLLTGSPELAEARAGVHRARCTVQRECAQRIPNVDLQAGVRYHHPADDTVATIEVGLPLPIFNRNQGNIHQVQAQLVSANREVQRVELQLRDRLAEAFRRYADARLAVQKHSTEILPNAEESLKMVQKGYQTGDLDYLTLLTAQRTCYRVNLAYLESLLEYRSSAIGIEGFLLSGGLQQPPAP